MIKTIPRARFILPCYLNVVYKNKLKLKQIKSAIVSTVLLDIIEVGINTHDSNVIRNILVQYETAFIQTIIIEY